MLPKQKEYFYTDSLKEVLHRMNAEDYVLVHNAIDHYVEEYKRGCKMYGLITTVYNFLKLIDKLIKEWKQEHSDIAMQISCKKGCKYCCEIQVMLSLGEAKLILNTMKIQKIYINKKKLRRQDKCEDWDTQPLKDRGCIFLDNDYICKIYESRPVSCRKYFVLDNPEKCDTNSSNTIIKRAIVIKAEIVASAMLNVDKTGTLPALLRSLKGET